MSTTNVGDVLFDGYNQEYELLGFDNQMVHLRARTGALADVLSFYLDRKKFDACFRKCPHGS